MLRSNISTEKLTIGTYAWEYLTNDEKVHELIEKRIFPSIAPEGTKTPFAVYERESYLVANTKMGMYQQVAVVLYEIVSDDYDSGAKATLAIYNRLQGKHGGFTFDLVDSGEFHKEGKYRQRLLFQIK